VTVDSAIESKEVKARTSTRADSRGTNQRKRLHPFSVDMLIEESMDKRYAI